MVTGGKLTPRDGRLKPGIPLHRLTRLGILLHMVRLDPKAPMSLIAAAKKWNSQKDTLCRVEHGRVPDTRTFLMLCEGLGIEPGVDLLDEPAPNEDLGWYLTRPGSRYADAVEIARAQLKSIIATDRTFSYVPGEPNAFQETPSKGAKWLTPRELAQLALARMEEIVPEDTSSGSGGVAR